MSVKLSRKVDWLSWTHIFEPMGEGASSTDVADQVGETLCAIFSREIAEYLFGNLAVLDYGRSPYKVGWRDAKHAVTVWASPTLTHFTVEVSGKGCQMLTEMGWLEPVIAAISHRLTRIDIAVDMLTDVTPQAFASQHSNNRLKTSAIMSSPTGDTCYVGSMHSERYARVYRYAEPHPRAGLLRVEHVFRRKHAQAVGEALSRNSLRVVCSSCRESFGWTHDLAEHWGNKVVDISVERPERNGGKTLSWLIKQAAPAFRKLCTEGIISDPAHFLEVYFLSDHYEEKPH